MKRKSSPDDWDWERKPKKLEKGTNKAGKHRKSIYNMLSDYEEDDFVYDSGGKQVSRNYKQFNYDKQR